MAHLNYQRLARLLFTGIRCAADSLPAPVLDDAELYAKT